jgi:hypothetical protein
MFGGQVTAWPDAVPEPLIHNAMHKAKLFKSIRVSLEKYIDFFMRLNKLFLRHFWVTAFDYPIIIKLVHSPRQSLYNTSWAFINFPVRIY